MKKLNQFFAKLFAGRLSDPADFKEALHQERVNQQTVDTSFERFTQTLRMDESWTAPKRLATEKAFFTSEGFLRRQDMADWQNTPIELRTFSARLIERLRRRGIPMYTHAAYRDKATQNSHFANRRSKLTWPYAPHCQGKAVDIVHGRYHWELTEQEWAYIGKVGKDLAEKMGLDVTWGGDWKFYDPAHWELTGWKENYDPNPTEGEPVRKTARKLLQDTKGV